MGSRASGAPLGLALLAVLLALSAANSLWLHPEDAAAARALVIKVYEAAKSGDLAGLSTSSWRWKRIQNRYGRAVDYCIVSQRHSLDPLRWKRGYYDFQVEVHRQRARTRELALAEAGPSRLYGYYASVSSVSVEKVDDEPASWPLPSGAGAADISIRPPGR